MTTQFNNESDRMTDTLKAFSEAMEETICHMEDNGCDDTVLDRIRPLLQDEVLSKEHIECFCWNLQVGGERLVAARFNLIPIEPIDAVAKALKEAGHTEEADTVRYIHAFALAVRRWYRAKFFDGGPAIEIRI